MCEIKNLPFGVTCSPFITISTTRRIASDFSDDPRVIETINNKMYNDDFLSSAKSLEEGIEEAVGGAQKTLYTALDLESRKMRYPTQEILRALLYEVAGLLNGLPLIAASTDPDDELSRYSQNQME